MRYYRSVVVVAFVAAVLTNVVLSQKKTGSGNPSDTKDTAANALDTKPPGKAELKQPEKAPNATNADKTVSADNTNKAKSPETGTAGQNGVVNGNGGGKEKTGRRKLRRRMNRRRGRKRNGNQQASQAQENGNSTQKAANSTTTSQNQSTKGAKDQAQTQNQAQTKGNKEPKLQTQEQAKAEAKQTHGKGTEQNKEAKAKEIVNSQAQEQKAKVLAEEQKARALAEEKKAKAQEELARAKALAEEQLAKAQAQARAEEQKAKAQALEKKANIKTQEPKAKAQAQTQTAQAQALVQKPVQSDVPAKKSKQFKQESKTKKEKTPMNIDTQSDFFDFFASETTTPPSTYAEGPPPNITFDKTSKKVMPKVDSKGSKAHDGRPCNETYRPDKTNKHRYKMRYAEGFWGTLDCPPNLGKGLVWRQDLCSCGEELVPQDPDDWCAKIGFSPSPDSKHEYTRRHHGAQSKMYCAANLVWSQEKCLCMYDPTVKDRPIETPVTFVCKKILHLKFEGNLKNSAESYHVRPVKLKRRGRLPRIRFVKVPGAVDKAAMIVSQPLEFLAFRGNDFQRHVTYTLNFKLSPRHLNRQNLMVLITDKCKENQVGPKTRKPSISLKFQPSTRSFRLGFRTTEREIDEVIKGAKPDRNGWYKTVVYFEDNSLNLENNGEVLFSLKDVKGKIPQNKCPLYIAGRGRGFDRSEDFYGYMDNVNLVKDCKFHQANIKLL